MKKQSSKEAHRNERMNIFAGTGSPTVDEYSEFAILMHEENAGRDQSMTVSWNLMPMLRKNSNGISPPAKINT